jgi:hypothetical protein
MEADSMLSSLHVYLIVSQINLFVRKRTVILYIKQIDEDNSNKLYAQVVSIQFTNKQ